MGGAVNSDYEAWSDGEKPEGRRGSEVFTNGSGPPRTFGKGEEEAILRKKESPLVMVKKGRGS